MTTFINLTPHEITILKKDLTTLSIKASGKIARVNELPNDVCGEIDGIPVLSKSKFTDVIDLPEPQEGIAYIVSGMVADRVSRDDVFSPATGPKDDAVRNEKGHIVAVKFLKSTKG